jgi:hypothetical protein
MKKALPGVDFTNILCEAFMCVDHKSAKRPSRNLADLAILGSTHLKAARKHVGEIELKVQRSFFPLD